jgi:hypothetical protein
MSIMHCTYPYRQKLGLLCANQMFWLNEPMHIEWDDVTQSSTLINKQLKDT